MWSVLVIIVAVAGGRADNQWRPMVAKLSRKSRKAGTDLTGGHGHGFLDSFSAPSRSSFASRSSARRGRQGPKPSSYEATQDREPIDLHNKEFCVDVSTYQPLVWVEREGEECTTTFIKKCEDKSENVCADVTETFCQVVPYTECTMGMEQQEATQTKLAPKLFVEKYCTQGKKEIPHTKLLPECRNVTKQNCVTLWETDQYGKQQWAGTDACEPVTWQECKLVPKDVKFIVPEIKCEPKQELWYHEPEPVTEIQMTNTFGCMPKSATSCKAQTRSDCKPIQWQECREVPVTDCQPKSVHIPTQEKLHRKKCLLPDDDKDSAPANLADVVEVRAQQGRPAGAPPPALAPSYGAPPPPQPPAYPQPTYSG